MILTLAHLERLVNQHGFELSDVARIPAMRVVCERPGVPTSRLQLELHIYARNTEGKRYLDRGTNEAAREVRLIPFDVMVEPPFTAEAHDATLEAQSP